MLWEEVEPPPINEDDKDPRKLVLTNLPQWKHKDAHYDATADMLERLGLCTSKLLSINTFTCKQVATPTCSNVIAAQWLYIQLKQKPPLYYNEDKTRHNIMVFRDRGRLGVRSNNTTPVDAPWKASCAQFGQEEDALTRDSRRAFLPGEAMVYRVTVVASPRVDVHAPMIQICDYCMGRDSRAI